MKATRMEVSISMRSPATITASEFGNDVGLLRGDWQERLAYIVDAMREMSQQTDAQEMVSALCDPGAQAVASRALAVD